MTLTKPLFVLSVMTILGVSQANHAPGTANNHHGCPTSWTLVVVGTLPDSIWSLADAADNKGKDFGHGDGYVCMKGNRVMDNQVGANDIMSP